MRRAGLLERRVKDPGRVLLKYVLYSLSLTYPVLLVSIGVFYGGLAFWTSFAASVGVIWIVLRGSGRGRTFATATFRFGSIVASFGAFAILAAFYYVLLYTNLKVLAVPILGGILSLVFLLSIWRGQKRSE